MHKESNFHEHAQVPSSAFRTRLVNKTALFMPGWNASNLLQNREEFFML